MSSHEANTRGRSRRCWPIRASIRPSIGRGRSLISARSDRDGQPFLAAQRLSESISLSPTRQSSKTAAMATDLNTRNRIQVLWKTEIEPPIGMLLDGSDLSFAEFTALYTAAYNWATAAHQLAQDPLSRYTELRAHVSRFLAAYTARIAAAARGDNAMVAEYYDAQWDHFSRGARFANRALSYFNRYCVRPAGTELHTFNQMALEQWKTRVFTRVVRRLKIVTEADPAWKARLDAITLASQPTG
ncbi:hypothetical protein FB451DRAFT_1243016 [Mycena latifolia]|nr:hypothetical protein FB451DRAFT_1243016 [Mycena latifolia]